MENTSYPKPGDTIYTPTRISIDHGWDDIAGGLATVSKVSFQLSAGKQTPFVEVEEIPGRSFNWKFLQEEQDALRKEHGNRKARLDPDFPDHWSQHQRDQWLATTQQK